MATNRAFLLACATVATLSLSATSSTHADAKPCHTDDSTPRQEKSCLVRSTIRTIMTEAAEQVAMAQKAAMEKQAAMQAAKAKLAAAKQAAVAKEAATDTAAAKSTARTPNPTAKSTPAGSPCLTKEYLDNGAVIFRDNCTGEWAQRER